MGWRSLAQRWSGLRSAFAPPPHAQRVNERTRRRQPQHACQRSARGAWLPMLRRCHPPLPSPRASPLPPPHPDQVCGLASAQASIAAGHPDTWRLASTPELAVALKSPAFLRAHAIQGGAQAADAQPHAETGRRTRQTWMAHAPAQAASA